LGIGADGKREDKDTVRLKQKATKSVAELELLVESLKRVIEKQKTEADALKKQVEVQEQRTDKLKSEKQLRQRIETLEQELHAYEMKDVNVDEKDRTI
jgi:cell division protein FtsB